MLEEEQMGGTGDMWQNEIIPNLKRAKKDTKYFLLAELSNTYAVKLLKFTSQVGLPLPFQVLYRAVNIISSASHQEIKSNNAEFQIFLCEVPHCCS